MRKPSAPHNHQNFDMHPEEPTAWEMMVGTKLSFLYTLLLTELLSQFPHTVYGVTVFGQLQ